MNLLYLIGAPGAGKTTVLREALSVSEVEPERWSKPLKLMQYSRWNALPEGATGGELRIWGYELGWPQGVGSHQHFGGTDTLPMNVQPRALAFVDFCRAYNFSIVAEGDRLANEKFFMQLSDWGDDDNCHMTVVGLDTPREVLAERRAQRPTWDPNPAWLAGRETKVRRLMERWVEPENRLDGSLSVAELADRLRAFPEVGKLLNGRFEPWQRNDSGTTQKPEGLPTS